MLDAHEFDRWRSEAGRALQAARVQAAAALHNWACFAAEQAAQLGVKALLHGLGRAPWGHDLVRLCERLQEVMRGAWPRELDVRVRRLSRHYIPARYPDAHPSGPPADYYGPQEADEAVADAEALLSAVDEAWSRLRQAKADA